MIAGAIIVAGGIFLAAFHFSGSYLTPQKTAESPISCPATHKEHSVFIQYGRILPEHTNAAACDTIKFTNLDNQIRAIAFGEHDHHTPYDGVTETQLGYHKSFTITLNKLGTYTFHDHFQEETAGSFTVTN